MPTAHLKHGDSGNLLHGPGGHLVIDCAGDEEPVCACADAGPPCERCGDATPTQFHVTFADVVLCTECVNCETAGVSAKVDGDAILDGTYVLTRNGPCAWSIASTEVPCSASLYTSADCTGSPTAISFAIQQVRISSTQFLLQVIDDSDSLVLFQATVTAPLCCAGYMTENELTECECDEGDVTVIKLGTGGMATVTPC